MLNDLFIVFSLKNVNNDPIILTISIKNIFKPSLELSVFLFSAFLSLLICTRKKRKVSVVGEGWKH
jgi:hypothetical protein